MEITTAILDDHDRQRRLFAALDEIARSDGDALDRVWSELAGFLEVHAAAEEKVLYPEVLKLSDPDAEETLDAIGDHNDIRDAIARAAAAAPGSEPWWAAVGDARAANTEHMGEEEDEVLPHFRAKASLALREQLGAAFVAAKTPSGAAVLDTDDKNPAEYVDQHT